MDNEGALGLGPGEDPGRPVRPVALGGRLLPWLLLGFLVGCAASPSTMPGSMPEAPPPATEPPSGEDKGWKPVTG